MTQKLKSEAVDEKVQKIQGKITLFTWVAWVCVAIGIAAASFALWKLFHETGDKFSWSNLSSLGSYFQGAVASVWSLAGLLFIYVAFLAQRQQLLQQDAELEDQKKQFKIQNDSIKQQNFEAAFFQLLGLQNQIASQMQRLSKDNKGNYEVLTEGRKCFGEWMKILKKRFSDKVNAEAADPKQIEFVTKCYFDYYNDRHGDFGHYFRNLYHVVKFVKVSDVENKRRYTSLARAQLSSPELFFLFYNGISPLGQKFKPLIEEFGLLENIDKTKLLDPSHESFYAKSAFE